jgi:hypothetical protein
VEYRYKNLFHEGRFAVKRAFLVDPQIWKLKTIFLYLQKNKEAIKEKTTKTIGKGLDQADFFTGFGFLIFSSYICKNKR